MLFSPEDNNSDMGCYTVRSELDSTVTTLKLVYTYMSIGRPRCNNTDDRMKPDSNIQTRTYNMDEIIHTAAEKHSTAAWVC